MLITKNLIYDVFCKIWHEFYLIIIFFFEKKFYAFSAKFVRCY